MSNEIPKQAQNLRPEDVLDQEREHERETLSVEDITDFINYASVIRRPFILKEMGQDFTEDIYDKCDPQLQQTIWSILSVLVTIPEPLAGKRGKRPLMNRYTMQIWLHVYLTKLKHPELPIKSNNKESVLKKLSSQPLKLGFKRVCWSEENWRRVLKIANKLIKKDERLKKETEFIVERIRYKEFVKRLTGPDGMDYIENHRKQRRRKLLKLAQPYLDQINDPKEKSMLIKGYREWLKTNINEEYKALKNEVKLIMG